MEIRLSNIYLSTPLDRRGREAMATLSQNISDTEFLDKLYVKPYFELFIDELESHKKSIVGTTISIQDNEQHIQDKDIIKNFINGTINEYIIPDDYIDNLKGEVKNRTDEISDSFKKLTDFNDSFERLDKTIYEIIGFAGCGKTTYSQYLFKKHKKTHNIYACDLDKSIPSFQFFTKRHVFDSKNNVWIFLGYMLQQVLHHIFVDEILDPDQNGYIKSERFKDIINNYFKYITIEPLHSSRNPHADHPDQIEVFEELRNYFDKEEYKDFNGFADFVIDRINNIKNSNEEKDENKRRENAIAFIIGIIIRLFFCLSRYNNKKYIFAIDGIEHFIYSGKRRIYNKQVTTIINGIKNAVDWMRGNIDYVKQNLHDNNELYNTFYGIVIMMRDVSETVTNGYEYNSQDKEYGYHDIIDINISGWFDIGNIIDKRKEYFYELINKIGGKEELIQKVFDRIRNDRSPYDWALSDIIKNLYNDNKRGVIECVTNAIENTTDANLKLFITEWDKAHNFQNYRGNLIHICRQYIFRLLLDYINSKQGIRKSRYFDDIMAAGLKYGPENNVTSYARRIATTLTNYAQIEGKKFISFKKLIKSVLLDHIGTNPSDKETIDLGNILYLMNDPNATRTHWNALIEIKLSPENAEDDEQKDIINALHTEWKNPKDTTEEFGIRIRPAGCFFSEFISEFEYFSCRSVINIIEDRTCPPLFECIRNDYERKEVLKAVYNTTMKCLDVVVKRESKLNIDTALWLYKDKYTGVMETHPERIFKQHVSYLEKYLDYAEKWIDDDKKIDKQSIINDLKSYISKYKIKYYELKKNKMYSRYFKINDLFSRY